MTRLSDLYKPKYLQLSEIIKDEIYLGKYKQGEKLPSENELMKEFNVSSITVRKCIDILKNADLIDRVQGVGTFIKINQPVSYDAHGATFGVSLVNSTNEWSNEVYKGIKKIMNIADGNVFISDALGENEKQADDVLNMISKKPDLIYILACDRKRMESVLITHGANTIPIISVESYLEHPSVKCHLSADQMINGIWNANNIIDFLAATHDGHVEGKVVIFYTSGLATLELRYKAMLLKLSEYPKIKILETVDYNITDPLDDSKRKLSSILDKYGANVDVVTALHGEPLTGLSIAIAESRLQDRIKVIGIDAFETIIEEMRREKPVIAAVHQDGFAMGTVAAKLGIRILQGEDVSYQYILPLTNIYAHFPNKLDNYPEQGKVKISCPTYLKETGFDWGY
jgi:ABC-type sugar transport system substrate-binding protein